MNYWLIKSEPAEFGWNDLVKNGTEPWTGVRNYAARNFLQQMRTGDRILFYHSVTQPGVVGIATVVREAYPDSTAGDDVRWVAVDVQAEQPFVQPVSLSTIKSHAALQQMPLIRQSRLSVMPVTEAEFLEILHLGGVSHL